MNKNLLPLSILIAGILIAGAAFFINQSRPSEEDTSKFLSLEEAGTKVIDFINNNILMGRATASLIESLEENGLYKIKFSIEGQEIESYITRDGNLFFPEAINLAEFQEPAVEQGVTIGEFSVSADEVCQEDGRPVVYFFSSESCPHCLWESPVIEGVAESFGDQISFHNNMNSEADREIFDKYSPSNGVPTLVLGCRYYRIGSGERMGEEEETRNLTALVCKLTNSKPEAVCSQVQDLINQIGD